MKRIFNLSILIIFLFSISSLLSSDKGSIYGKVFDAESSEPLPGATIRLESTPYGAIAKRGGEFTIRSVSPGSYSLLVSILGYELKKISVEVLGSGRTEVNIGMKVQPLQSGEVIVSANKRIQAVQEVPISVSVFDRRILDERNVTQLDEALVYVPGVSLNGDHVSIRGSSGFAFGTGSRVALLMDGFSLLSGDAGDIKFDALPIFNIERVEVVKGAGSALYGTSAIGGIVNVITTQATEEPEFRFRLYSGIYTEPRYESWVNSDSPSMTYGLTSGFSQKFGKLGVIFSGGYLRDESYRLYDDSHRYNLFTKLNYDFNDNTTLSLIGNYSGEDKTDWIYWNSLDSATRPPTNTNYNNRLYSDKLTIIGKLGHIFSDRLFVEFRSGLFRTKYKNNLKISDPEHRSSEAISLNNEFQVNYRFSKTLFSTSGINYIFSDVESRTYGTHHQQILSAYSQVETKILERITLNIGARLDYEKTESIESNIEFSPKIGVLYSSGFGPQFRASIGKGFRAAAIGERFASVAFQGFDVVPNPNLKSEHSWSYETGVYYELPFFEFPMSVDVAVFRNDLYDLIEPTFSEEISTEIVFKNITEAKILGLELNIKTLLLDFIGLETGFTAMDPENVKTGETLRYRSKYLWYSRAFLMLGPVEIHTDYRYLSNTENVDEQIRFQVDDYDARVPVHVLDARLILRLDKLSSLPFTLTFNAKNMLDYYYTNMVGNLAPTRSLVLQIDGKF